MNKKYLYVLLLTLLPVVVYFNSWQNIALFAFILGYTAFLEITDRKEVIKVYEARISYLEEHSKLVDEKMGELRTKLGIFGMSKNIQGK